MARPKNDSYNQLDVIDEQVMEQSVPLSQLDSVVNKLVEEKLKAINASTVSKKSNNVDVSRDFVANYDEIPELQDFEFKDRMYVLMDDSKPFSYGIRNRSKKGSPLQYLHPVTKVLHSLRYSTNQVSFFEDKQSKEAGSVAIGYINVTSGMLFVPKENTHLQKFLHIHPDRNIRWKELNKEEDAKKELDVLDLRFKAESLVRNLDLISQEAMARLVCEDYSEDWDTATMRKELFLKIKKSSKPETFIKLAEDTTLGVKGLAKTAVYRGYLKYDNFKFYDQNNTVVLEVGRLENEYDAIARYLLSNDGYFLKEELEEKLR